MGYLKPARDPAVPNLERPDKIESFFQKGYKIGVRQQGGF